WSTWRARRSATRSARSTCRCPPASSWSPNCARPPSPRSPPRRRCRPRKRKPWSPPSRSRAAKRKPPARRAKRHSARRRRAADEAAMLILAGLGNPEPRYARNRHNIGFAAMQVIARRWDFSPARARFQGLVAEGQIPTPAGPVKALTLRPQTYYNGSGDAVAAAMRFYKAQPSDVVVFYDEIDLAP